MRAILPKVFWSGVSIAVYTCTMVPMIIACLGKGESDQEQEDSIRNAMMCMVCLGVGEMLGAPFIGQVIDKTSNKTACLVNMF